MATDQIAISNGFITGYGRIRPRCLAGLERRSLKCLIAMVACGLATTLAQDVAGTAVEAGSCSIPTMPGSWWCATGTVASAPIRHAADWNVRRDHILAHFQDVAGTLPGGDAGFLSTSR